MRLPDLKRRPAARGGAAGLKIDSVAASDEDKSTKTGRSPQDRSKPFAVADRFGIVHTVFVKLSNGCVERRGLFSSHNLAVAAADRFNAEFETAGRI